MIKTTTYPCVMAVFIALATQMASAQTANPQATPAAPAASATPTPPAPPVPIAFNEAVQQAATALMSGVPESVLKADGSEIAIDPLIDGYTGGQNTTTVKMGRDISDVVKQKYARFKVVPFTADTIAKKPLILVGTFRPVNFVRRDCHRMHIQLTKLHRHFAECLNCIGMHPGFCSARFFRYCRYILNDTCFIIRQNH